MTTHGTGTEQHEHRWTAWYRVWTPDGFRRICRDGKCLAQEFKNGR